MTSLERLRAHVAALDNVVVAFSGGADSALLAYIANEQLGDGAVSVTAASASLAPEELDDCRSLANEWGLRWVTVETKELDDEAYRANDGMRCARCKTALMDELEAVAAERNAKVVLGVNTDDLGDYRPGQKAAAERGAVFPYVELGIGKAEVRAISAELGLRTHDKPAAACLSSRVPYGTPVTLGTLGAVARAESALRALGLDSLRVRHYDDTARIEVPVADLARVVDMRDEVIEGVKDAGYRYVTLDLEGLRSGNLNAALVAK